MDEQTPTRATVVAAVVTHHPDAAAVSRLRALASQFDRLLVVDNGSSAATRGALQSLAREEPEITLLLNPENLGVAAALNQACRYAVEGKAAWIATFDQDSVPADDWLEGLAAEWEKQPDPRRIGLVGVNFRSMAGATSVSEGSDWSDVRAVITSGSLLNLSAWQDVGPFREELFIDEVDHEYSLRLRRGGWSVKLARRVRMAHDFGTARVHRLLGWPIIVSHHPALRRYYMVRNRVILGREYVTSDPRFVGERILCTLRDAAGILLFESNKSAKFAAMARGLADGLRGRGGRADRRPSEPANLAIQAPCGSSARSAVESSPVP